MARPQKVSDETIRKFQDLNYSQADIAALTGVSEAAISKRVAQMEIRDAALADGRAVTSARTSVWNVRQKLEWLQGKTEEIIESDTFDAIERIAAVNSLLGQMRFAMTSLNTLYSIEEQAAFQEEVLAILEEFEPGSREKVLARIREKRPLRAAILGGGNEVPGTEVREQAGSEVPAVASGG